MKSTSCKGVTQEKKEEGDDDGEKTNDMDMNICKSDKKNAHFRSVRPNPRPVGDTKYQHHFCSIKYQLQEGKWV